MATETNVQFLLSIWRDYAPPHPVALRYEQEGFAVVTPEHSLQTEVYSWPMQQDHLAGVSKEETRNRLRELLDELDVSRPPAERSLVVLGDFVAEAEKAIKEGEADPVASGFGDTTVQNDPLLALVLHLKWVIQCFKDRPGISVSKR